MLEKETSDEVDSSGDHELAFKDISVVTSGLASSGRSSSSEEQEGSSSKVMSGSGIGFLQRERERIEEKLKELLGLDDED